MKHHEKLWFLKPDQCVIVGWALGMRSYPENLTGSKVYILCSIHWTKYRYITPTLVSRTLHFVIRRNIPTSEKVELYKSWLVKQEAWIGIIKQKKNNNNTTKKHGKVNFPLELQFVGTHLVVAHMHNNLFHSKTIQLKWGLMSIQDDNVLALGGRRSFNHNHCMMGW